MFGRGIGPVAIAGIALLLGGCAVGGEDEPEKSPAASGTRSKVRQPAIFVRTGRKDVRVGSGTTLRGGLAFAPGGDGGRAIRLLADGYPFAEFAPVATTRTRKNGKFRFRVRPQRNTRYRVELPGERPVRSNVLAVFASPLGDIKAEALGPTTARLTFTAPRPRGLRLRRTQIHFYFGPKGAKRLRRVGKAYTRTDGPRRVVATTTAQLSQSGTVGSCQSGAFADGLGRTLPSGCRKSERASKFR